MPSSPATGDPRRAQPPGGGETVFVDSTRPGAHPAIQLFCHPCRIGRPATGFSSHATYQFCAGCTAEFDVASAWRNAPSAGQFVRDKQFGEESLYALSALAAP